MNVVIEAIVVGIVMMIMGFPSGMLASKILPVVDNNHIPVMYLSLFLTGLSSHLVFEVLQINKWYCKYGASCLP